jgi:hypothetical protein
MWPGNEMHGQNAGPSYGIPFFECSVIQARPFMLGTTPQHSAIARRGEGNHLHDAAIVDRIRHLLICSNGGPNGKSYGGRDDLPAW